MHDGRYTLTDYKVSSNHLFGFCFNLLPCTIFVFKSEDGIGRSVVIMPSQLKEARDIEEFKHLYKHVYSKK